MADTFKSRSTNLRETKVCVHDWQMSNRAKITTGLALLTAVVVMLARDFNWLVIPVTLFAVFLILWGRAQLTTEKYIGGLPGGRLMLKWLDQLDMILAPRDRELEKYLRGIIERYDQGKRIALKNLLDTRNPYRTGAEWPAFNADGLVIGTFSGPGPIKEEFRDPIKRILTELGD